MRVTVTGATGLIGQRLVASLRARGDEVTVLTRNPEQARQKLTGIYDAVQWDLTGEPAPAAALLGRDAVVHLAGENVAQRWSASAKQAILSSRVEGTKQLVRGLASLEQSQRPRVLVSGSAIGYYGTHGEEPIDEDAPAGGDFLARVCRAWEVEALEAQALPVPGTGADVGEAAGESADGGASGASETADSSASGGASGSTDSSASGGASGSTDSGTSGGASGMRVATLRTGVVLDREGGALGKMLPPFKLGVGGPVAGGRQFVSWVHTSDVVGIALAAIDGEEWEGPINVTAPDPQRNRDFSRALGRALHRPSLLPVPGAALRLLYGEMAEIVTGGARVLPAKALVLGYEFRYPQLDAALEAALDGD